MNKYFKNFFYFVIIILLLLFLFFIFSKKNNKQFISDNKNVEKNITNLNNEQPNKFDNAFIEENNITQEYNFQGSSFKVKNLKTGKSINSSEEIINLSGICKLTGECKNKRISISPEATVILDNFNLECDSDSDCFICNGSNKLILKGKNKINCNLKDIQVGSAVSLSESSNLSVYGYEDGVLEISGFPVGISGLQDVVGDSRDPIFNMYSGNIDCSETGCAISVEHSNFYGGNFINSKS